MKCRGLPERVKGRSALSLHPACGGSPLFLNQALRRCPAQQDTHEDAAMSSTAGAMDTACLTACVMNLGAERLQAWELACDVMYQVQQAQHFQLVSAGPHAPIQPLSQVEEQVVHISLEHRCTRQHCQQCRSTVGMLASHLAAGVQLHSAWQQGRGACLSSPHVAVQALHRGDGRQLLHIISVQEDGDGDPAARLAPREGGVRALHLASLWSVLGAVLHAQHAASESCIMQQPG